MTQPKPAQEITSALGSKTTKELLEEANREKTDLRGRQVKHNDLSPEEEARLQALPKVIESLEKNLATEEAIKLGEEAAKKDRED